MPFERFTSLGRSNRPKITVTRQGVISFNKGATRRYAMHDYTHAVLFWDGESRRVGVMLTSMSDEEGAVPIRFRQSGADISARSFLEFYDIPYRQEKRNYEPERIYHDDHVMVVFNVDSPIAKA